METRHLLTEGIYTSTVILLQNGPDIVFCDARFNRKERISFSEHQPETGIPIFLVSWAKAVGKNVKKIPLCSFRQCSQVSSEPFYETN